MHALRKITTIAIFCCIATAATAPQASAAEWAAELWQRFERIDPAVYRPDSIGERADGATGAIFPHAQYSSSAEGSLLANLFTLSQLQRHYADESAPEAAAQKLDRILAVEAHLYATRVALARTVDTLARRCELLTDAAADRDAIRAGLGAAGAAAHDAARFPATVHAAALVDRATGDELLTERRPCLPSQAQGGATVTALVRGRARSGVKDALSTRVRTAITAFDAASRTLDEAHAAAEAAMAGVVALQAGVRELKARGTALEINFSTVMQDKLTLSPRATALREEVERAKAAVDQRPGADLPWLEAPPEHCGSVGDQASNLKPASIGRAESLAFSCGAGGYSGLVAIAAGSCNVSADYDAYLRSQDVGAVTRAAATLTGCAQARSAGGVELARTVELFAKELETFFGCLAADDQTCKPL